MRRWEKQAGNMREPSLKQKTRKCRTRKKKGVCFGCSWVGQPSSVEPTTQPVPDSTNRLAQQMEPQKHEGNARTYHILHERSRKTSNRPCTTGTLSRGLWQTFTFPTSTLGASYPDHRPSRKVQQNKSARTKENAVKQSVLGTYPSSHAEPYWPRVQRP